MDTVTVVAIVTISLCLSIVIGYAIWLYLDIRACYRHDLLMSKPITEMTSLNTSTKQS